MHALLMVLCLFVVRTRGYTVAFQNSLKNSRLYSASLLQTFPSGVCAVYKPKDWTSNDVVQKIKAILETEHRKRTSDGDRIKVGHGGTLDPIAEGVLVIGIGEGTRVMNEYLTGSKGYLAKGCFGEEYDTLDRTGKVIETKPYKHITEQDIRNIIPQFTGDIMQVPPMFSALKRDGETLYNLARKGIEVEREPRPVKVYNCSLSNLTLPQFEIEVECGAGFYIRTLISDMAKKVNSVAHMTELIRTKQGLFTVEDCLTKDNWTYEMMLDHVLTCSKKVNLDASKLLPSKKQINARKYFRPKR